jgi:hypothetical protein
VKIDNWRRRLANFTYPARLFERFFLRLNDGCISLPCGFCFVPIRSDCYAREGDFAIVVAIVAMRVRVSAKRVTAARLAHGLGLQKRRQGARAVAGPNPRPIATKGAMPLFRATAPVPASNRQTTIASHACPHFSASLFKAHALHCWHRLSACSKQPMPASRARACRTGRRGGTPLRPCLGGCAPAHARTPRARAHCRPPPRTSREKENENRAR